MLQFLGMKYVKKQRSAFFQNWTEYCTKQKQVKAENKLKYKILIKYCFKDGDLLKDEHRKIFVDVS